MKSLFSAILLLASLLLPGSAPACSPARCERSSVELNRSFSVRVTHKGQPLAGAIVEIRKGDYTWGPPAASRVTRDDGIVQFTNLRPGSYQIATSFLGISADSECVQINTQPSKAAQNLREYQWGKGALALRQAAGQLLDDRIDDRSPFPSERSSAEPALSGAALELHPAAGKVYSTTSDKTGRFAFPSVPLGTYVLRVRALGGPDPMNLLIELDPSAKGASLLARRRESSPAACRYGPYLEIIH